MQDFRLPKLSPLLELYPSKAGEEGEPRWTLYDPVGNSYFRIDWAEFECLARFHECQKASDLLRKIHEETTIRLDMHSIAELVQFLIESNLVEGASALQKPKTKEHVLKRVLKSYLFFSVPLFEPQQFLERTIIWLKPLFYKWVNIAVFAIFLMSVILVIPRFDEFITTFPNFLTLEGIALGLFVFIVTKVIHELAHAYVATYYGIPVSHIGVAFILLYPVLYTEATASWSLKDPRKRVLIGLAGVIAEMYIATAFLLLWSVTTQGFLNTLSFTVVAITFIGTLLINLNPLMRFDGYYVLSDYMEIDNLQDRSLGFARWFIRKVLFALEDPPPEMLRRSMHSFLIAFGLAMLIYRFFLFLGIALFVYYVFFKPLGLFLMVVELWWFIVRPIINEIKVWADRRGEIMQSRRSKLLAILVVVVLATFFAPIHRGVSVPAVMHAKSYQSIYPVAPALIEQFNVSENQSVIKGEILAVLVSEALEKDITVLKSERKFLVESKRQMQRLGTSPEELVTIDQQIQEKQLALLDRQREKENLTIRAPFDGHATDIPRDMHAGRYVSKDMLLMRVVNKEELAFSAYVDEQRLGLLETGQKGVFLSNNALFRSKDVVLNSISSFAADQLQWPELSSVYSGPIAADAPDRTSKEQHVPRRSLYLLEFKLANGKKDADMPTVERGTIIIGSGFYSYAYYLFQSILSFLQLEVSVNT